MIKMTCGICKGSGHVGPDGDMVTEQPCCQCNGSGDVFVVAPAQPATNTGSTKLPLDIKEKFMDFAMHQKDIPPKAAQIINDNFWDLV
jgi:DnaJ-class molecular chaperone